MGGTRNSMALLFANKYPPNTVTICQFEHHLLLKMFDSKAYNYNLFSEGYGFLTHFCWLRINALAHTLPSRWNGTTYVQ